MVVEGFFFFLKQPPKPQTNFQPASSPWFCSKYWTDGLCVEFSWIWVPESLPSSEIQAGLTQRTRTLIFFFKEFYPSKDHKILALSCRQVQVSLGTSSLPWARWQTSQTHRFSSGVGFSNGSWKHRLERNWGFDFALWWREGGISIYAISTKRHRILELDDTLGLV